MQYINSNKLNEIKLNKDNFYVLIDFDRTITQGGSVSSWNILNYSTLLGPDFRKKRKEIHKPKPNGDDKIKIEYYEDKFKKYLKIQEDFNLNDIIIDDVVREIPLVFRDSAKEFFLKMYELKIPVIIISCSIKNILEKVLRVHNCYYDNIEIYSNYYDYSEQRNHIYNITPYSKNKISFSKKTNKLIENRKYIVLLGDRVEDIKMVSKDKLENTISFGFLDEDKGIEKNLEKYNSNFDVVLTNDSSFEDVIKILKI